MLLRLLFPILATGELFSNQVYNYIPYRQYDGLIQKSNQDTREYLGLELHNKLRVLLISDPRATQGGVALSVASGANDDPDEIPGMAHFCEHLVLMGSKKYPSPTEFKDFLAATGGERNAATTRDYTVYFFDVEHWALDGAMDLFSQFFVAPKFDEAEVLREANAVDFEYQRANGWSSFAFDQAVLAGLNSTHKAARFIIGTYNTLITEPRKMDMDIREKVVAHYMKHYSSNIMHLVVSGKEDIETLKGMVIPRFSHIPNRNLVPTNVGSPFNSNNMGTNVVIDLKDKHEVTIAFVIKPISYSHYQTTLKFLDGFFTTTAKGYINNIIATLQLATHLDYEVKMQNGMLQLLFRFHVINKDTTPTELTRILFAYLNAIKTQGITQERYQAFLEKSRATPPSKSPASMYVKSLAVHFTQGANFKSILGIYDDTPIFDKQLLLSYIDQLNPTNFNIYETRNLPQDSQIEPWFGLKYSSSKINSTFLQGLYLVTAEDYGITLPPSRHINFETLRVNEDTFKTQVKVLANNSIGSVISVNTKAVRDPSVKFQLDFGLHPSPKLLPFLDLLKEISETYFNNKSSLYSQNAYYFQTEEDSLIFVLRDKQEMISQRIIHYAKMLKGFTATWHSFLSSKASFFEFWKDKNFYSEDDIPLTDLPRLLNPYFRDYQHTLAEVTALTPAEFQYCVRHMQENLRFNLLASGNISSELLVSLKHQIEDIFALNATKLLYENTQPPALLPGSYVYVEKYRKNNSVILFYLDLFPLGDVTRYAMAQVTKVLISTRFFHQLRTIEQLGYVVEMSLTNQNHMGGLVGIIQGIQSPVYLESRIESFLFYFVEEIKSIPEARLNLTIASIARVLNKPPANIPSGFGFDWEIVQNFLPETEQTNMTVEFLPTLTKDTFIHFLETSLLKTSPSRKKLSIHLNHPHLAYAKPTNYSIKDCGYQVDDYTSFHLMAF